MTLDELLGIDLTDPVALRARRLREADRKLLGELVAKRRELRLSQEEVARRMDTSQATVARIESGVRDLHQSTVRRYAMAVEVFIEHLVTTDDRGLARSAAMLRDFKDQIETSSSTWMENFRSEVVWDALSRTGGRKPARNV